MWFPYRCQVNLSGAPLIIVDNCYRAFANSARNKKSIRATGIIRFEKSKRRRTGSICRD